MKFKWSIRVTLKAEAIVQFQFTDKLASAVSLTHKSIMSTGTLTRPQVTNSLYVKRPVQDYWLWLELL